MARGKLPLLYGACAVVLACAVNLRAAGNSGKGAEITRGADGKVSSVNPSASDQGRQSAGAKAQTETAKSTVANPLPPVCVPDGSCSAPAPFCGQTTFGVDNCGGSCSRTGPDCCQPATSCSGGQNCGTAPDGCGGTLNCGSCSGVNTCGGGGMPNVCGCTNNGTCSNLSGTCGTVTGTDNCGASCTVTLEPCCTPSTTCSPLPGQPACGTVAGTFGCGTTCEVVQDPCCVVTNCDAPEPMVCGQTTFGFDNCGGTCSKSSPACCVPDPGTCNAPEPFCGQTTQGTGNCGTCFKVGAPCSCEIPPCL